MYVCICICICGQHEWDHAVKKGPNAANDIIFNTVASGIAFYLYNEFAFAFTAKAAAAPQLLSPS